MARSLISAALWDGGRHLLEDGVHSFLCINGAVLLENSTYLRSSAYQRKYGQFS